MEDKEKLIEEYLKLKEIINDATNQQKFIKSQLKIIMDVEQVDKLDCEKGYAFIQNRLTETVNKNLVKEILGEDKFKEVIKTTNSSFVMIKENIPLVE